MFSAMLSRHIQPFLLSDDQKMNRNKMLFPLDLICYQIFVLKWKFDVINPQLRSKYTNLQHIALPCVYSWDYRPR